MEVCYCLAPGYGFVESSLLNAPGFTAGLLDKSSDTVLLLNAELTALLTLFREPASVTEAAVALAQQLNAPVADVRAIVEDSVDTYVQRGILARAASRQEADSYSFPTLKAPHKIDKYFVLNELSATPPVGVYLVRNQAGKQYVLKKLFLDPGAPRAQIRDQQNEFAYEFEILAHLQDCPLVSQLVTFDPVKGIGVINYFAGVSLRRFITGNSESLSQAHRMDLFSQLLDAMDGLHSRNVLHGDLHSSNVLVNEDKRIKLIDFDMAFFWRDRAKNKVKFGGITDFIPPERLTDDVFHQSAGPPDFRAEVYQIGVIGYFIFNGKLPFVGQTWRQQLEAIRHSAVVWEVGVPARIQQLIDRALHKNPAQRFASATAMRAALV
ncbi:MAG: protein kinase [Spirosoma sp.]|nr:protein kinase [Spirosoma sp.]